MSKQHRKPAPEQVRHPLAHGVLDHEQVRHLAHQYWRERGSPTGTPDEDWFRAEAELRLQAEKALRL